MKCEQALLFIAMDYEDTHHWKCLLPLHRTLLQQCHLTNIENILCQILSRDSLVPRLLPKPGYEARVEIQIFTVVREVLRNNYQSRNVIGS